MDDLIDELKLTHEEIKKGTSTEQEFWLRISEGIFANIYLYIMAAKIPSDIKKYRKLYDKIQVLHVRLEKARMSSTPSIQIKIIKLYQSARDILEVGAKTVFEIEDEQVERVKSKKYFEMTQKEWLNVPEIKDELYGYVQDTFNTTNKMNALKEDQRIRASELIKDLLETQEVDILFGLGDEKTRQTEQLTQGRIILMDGHGRMIWQLLHEWHVVLQKTEPLQLVLVEFNKDNYNFHKINLPKDIEHIYGDIFDAKALRRAGKADVVYYNFTSLGKQAPTLFRRLAQHSLLGVRTHWSFMRQFSPPKRPPAALFSHAYWFINETNWYYGMLEGTNAAAVYSARQVSRRNAFYTMKLDFSQVVTIFDFDYVGLPDVIASANLNVARWSRLLEHLFSVDLYTLRIKKSALVVGETPKQGERDTRFKVGKSELKQFVTKLRNLIDTIIYEYEEKSRTDTSDLEAYTYVLAMAMRTKHFLDDKIKLKVLPKERLSDLFSKLRF